MEPGHFLCKYSGGVGGGGRGRHSNVCCDPHITTGKWNPIELELSLLSLYLGTVTVWMAFTRLLLYNRRWANQR